MWVSQLKFSAILSGGIMFLSGALVTLIVVWSLPSIMTPRLQPSSPHTLSSFIVPPSITTQTVPNLTTFYDDPELSYSVEKPIKNWDQKRHQWLASHPSFSGSVERVLIVTGSQPKACKNPIGDHLLLRLFKNKVDYCRIHGCDVFYNNVLLHPKVFEYWAKYPAVKAAMIAHPEVEWILWIDADAVFTDMDFSLPLVKYKGRNLVVYGWPEVLYEKKLCNGINAGVFLIRNCQWSMDLLDRWAAFGPQNQNYERWGKILKSIFTDKEFPESDDQSALSYLLLKEKETWADKIHIETEYYLQGYWLEIAGKFENVTGHYAEIERRVSALGSRHAEKAGEDYREKWKKYLDSTTGDYTIGSLRRPFVTHFTGCEPCTGDHNPKYASSSCWEGMVRALNFADNQVLRNFGYTRRDLSNSSLVEPL